MLANCDLTSPDSLAKEVGQNVQKARQAQAPEKKGAKSLENASKSFADAAKKLNQAPVK